MIKNNSQNSDDWHHDSLVQGSSLIKEEIGDSLEPVLPKLSYTSQNPESFDNLSYPLESNIILSENFFSDNFLSNIPPLQTERTLESDFSVNLYHKPRGCKGIWQLIEYGNDIRVTKGKGKWLKLEISGKQEFKDQDLEVHLVDPTKNQIEITNSESEGICIESCCSQYKSQLERYEAAIELKLDRVSKNLQFWIILKMKKGNLTLKSVRFGSHNNGKANIQPTAKPPPEETNSTNSSPTSSLETNSSIENEVSNPISEQVISKPSQKKRKKKNFEEDEEDDQQNYTVVPRSLEVHGVVRAQSFIQFSDLRLKTDISDLKDAVKLISQLEGKTFVWKDDQLPQETGGKRVIGLIAQQVQKILPEAVHEDENGYLSVSYSELIPVLIEAFKSQMEEQKQEREETQKQLKELRLKLEEIQKTSQDKANPSTIDPSIAVSDTSMEIDECDEKQLLVHNRFKKPFVKTGVLITFLIGVLAIIFGSMMFGTAIIGSPSLFITTVRKAVDLKAMDRNGESDPYVEVRIGAEMFRSQTVWNTKDPIFEETFQAKIDSSILRVVYQLYDDDMNPSFPSRRMGLVTLEIKEFEKDKLYEKWLELTPNLEGDPMSGKILVEWILKTSQQSSFGLLILVTGIFLTSFSLLFGYYLSKRERQNPS